MLIKDQATVTQNGVYTRIADLGGRWRIQRTADFDEAYVFVTPRLAGSLVFVNLGTGGAVNPGTTWSLQLTVTQLQPPSSSVLFTQTAGGQTLTAGNGIDAALLPGGTIAVDITPRLVFTLGELDLAIVTPAYGGAGTDISALALGSVLLSNGAPPMLARPAPPDVYNAVVGAEFMGTTDSQIVINKTQTDVSNLVRQLRGRRGRRVDRRAADGRISGRCGAAACPANHQRRASGMRVCSCAVGNCSSVYAYYRGGADDRRRDQVTQRAVSNLGGGARLYRRRDGCGRAADRD